MKSANALSLLSFLLGLAVFMTVNLVFLPGSEAVVLDKVICVLAVVVTAISAATPDDTWRFFFRLAASVLFVASGIGELRWHVNAELAVPTLVAGLTVGLWALRLWFQIRIPDDDTSDENLARPQEQPALDRKDQP